MSCRALLGTVGVVLMAALADPTTAVAQGPGDGAYTQAQADRGRRIFGAFCATCHGVDLEGAVGPTLAGPGFTAKWARPERSVQDLYDWHTCCPEMASRRANGSLRRRRRLSDGFTFHRAIDRQTHERLYQTPVTTQTNVDVPLTREGVRVCPGILGGVEWNGPAYHPGTGLRFTVAVDRCTTFSRWDSVRWAPGEMYLGGGYALDSTSQGWLTAVDASTGKVRWRYRSELPMVAAVTTTAGGLVLTGENTGDFLALDAATGRELYRFNTGAAWAAGSSATA